MSPNILKVPFQNQNKNLRPTGKYRSHGVTRATADGSHALAFLQSFRVISELSECCLRLTPDQLRMQLLRPTEVILLTGGAVRNDL